MDPAVRASTRGRGRGCTLCVGLLFARRLSHPEAEGIESAGLAALLDGIERRNPPVYRAGILTRLGCSRIHGNVPSSQAAAGGEWQATHSLLPSESRK